MPLPSISIVTITSTISTWKSTLKSTTLMLPHLQSHQYVCKQSLKSSTYASIYETYEQLHNVLHIRSTTVDCLQSPFWQSSLRSEASCSIISGSADYLAMLSPITLRTNHIQKMIVQVNSQLLMLCGSSSLQQNTCWWFAMLPAITSWTHPGPSEIT